MNVKPDPQDLEGASRWYARRLSPDWTADDQSAFDVWHAEPARARAYGLTVKLAEMPLRHAGNPRLQALAASALEYAEDQTPPQEHGSDGRVLKSARLRRWAVPASLAAGLAFLLLGARLVMEPMAPSAPQVSTYETPTGQRKTLLLEDGTVVHADVETRLTVRIGATSREVELLAGRALFLVAHDSARPFSVTAGATRTVALGTQFQVQRRQEAVLVTLAEGSVRVSESTTESGWQNTLVPGEQLALDSAASLPRTVTIDPVIVTGWTRGRLLFRGTPLAEAVEEINRYATLKVRIADPTLVDLKVGGNFIAGDSLPVVSAFAAALPLTIVESGDELLLYRRNDKGG